MKKIIFIGLSAIVLLAACDGGEKSTTDNTTVKAEETLPTADTMQTGNDAAWAMEVADGGMLEVKLGELAQQNASSAEVKEFGAMMVKDHGAANNELMALAGTQNITLPAALSEKSQKKYDEMAAMKGKDFDKAYTKDMVADHEADIKKFEEEAASGQNAELKSFAGKTLPTLNHHLEMVKGINAKMNN